MPLQKVQVLCSLQTDSNHFCQYLYVKIRNEREEKKRKKKKGHNSNGDSSVTSVICVFADVLWSLVHSTQPCRTGNGMIKLPKYPLHCWEIY